MRGAATKEKQGEEEKQEAEAEERSPAVESEGNREREREGEREQRILLAGVAFLFHFRPFYLEGPLFPRSFCFPPISFCHHLHLLPLLLVLLPHSPLRRSIGGLAPVSVLSFCLFFSFQFFPVGFVLGKLCWFLLFWLPLLSVCEVGLFFFFFFMYVRVLGYLGYLATWLLELPGLAS